jgi:hypothetical protein
MTKDSWGGKKYCACTECRCPRIIPVNWVDAYGVCETKCRKGNHPGQRRIGIKAYYDSAGDHRWDGSSIAKWRR